MKTYDQHIAECAATLEAVLRRGVKAYVVAVPTVDAANPGFLTAIAETDPVPPRGRIVRPCDNRASLHTDWRTVAYSNLRHTLWHAARLEPILAIA